MPPDVRHLFVSPVAATNNSGRLVQGPNWNETHNLQQGPASLLGRSDSTPGQAPTQEVLLDPATMAFAGGKLASIGSSFTQAGTGAVNRTVQDRLADEIHVDDFIASPFDPAADYTTQIQAAINAAAGKTLIFGNHTYKVSHALGGACLTLPAAGITIRGQGRYASILSTTSQAAHIAAVNAVKVVIENMGFDGVTSAAVAWQTGVVMRGVSRVRIAGCWFTRLGQGCINCSKTGFGGSDTIPNGSTQSEMIEIVDNLFEDIYGTVTVVSKYVGSLDTIVSRNIFRGGPTAISIESQNGTAGVEYADRIVVNGNIIYNLVNTRGTANNICWGIGISEQARHVSCSNNVIDLVVGATSSAGINITTSPSQTDTEVQNVACVGNMISRVSATSGKGHGILYQAGNTTIRGFTCSANVIDVCTDGIALETAAGAATTGGITNLSVSGNTIRNMVEIGIVCLVTGGSGEIAIAQVAITGNIITGCTIHGMSLNLINSVISGNTISSNTGVGIFLNTLCLYNQITGNCCFSNGDNGMTLNGNGNSIVGNTCLNNGQVAATSYGIYSVTGANTVIAYNRCSDTQGTATQDYGIRAVNGSTLRNNEVIGNALAPIFNPIANYNTGTYDAGLNRTA